MPKLKNDGWRRIGGVGAMNLRLGSVSGRLCGRRARDASGEYQYCDTLV